MFVVYFHPIGIIIFVLFILFQLRIMKTCIVADNQFITREGISALIKRAGIENIVCAKTMTELQKELSFFPDALVVLDYSLFDFVSMQQMLIVKAMAKNRHGYFFPTRL